MKRRDLEFETLVREALKGKKGEEIVDEDIARQMGE